MDYSTIAKNIRKNILHMGYRSQEGHIGSALSCVDVLTVLYFKVLSIDPAHPTAENRDRFIFSKGHAVSALYATLAERGFFPEKDLEKYCENGETMAGHATRGSVVGVEASTGSLGHGLSVAVGLALAFKKDKKNTRSFVLMSDGECNEGTTWEASLFASQQKLDNLVAIIDYNKLQGFGRTSEVLQLEPLVEKFTALGWAVRRVDGHNHAELEKTLLSVPFEPGKPNMVICDTVKGKGVIDMEDKVSSHYTHLTKESYEKALQEL